MFSTYRFIEYLRDRIQGGPALRTGFPDRHVSNHKNPHQEPHGYHKIE